MRDLLDEYVQRVIADETALIERAILDAAERECGAVVVRGDYGRLEYAGPSEFVPAGTLYVIDLPKLPTHLGWLSSDTL